MTITWTAFRGLIGAVVQLFVLGASLTIGLAGVEAQTPPRVMLPALGANGQQTSVSGLSSGAYMAGQYQFAHARSVVGAAIIAGGPFGCAEARNGTWYWPGARLAMNATQSLEACMQTAWSWYGIPDAAALAAKARALAQTGAIDPIDAIARHRIYLFSGGRDHIVDHQLVVAAAEVYLRLGIARDQMTTGTQEEAGHGVMTVPKSDDCGQSQPPFVLHCGVDQAQDLLAHIYGSLVAKSAPLSTGWITFDQRPFMQGQRSTGLADAGSAYVPADCQVMAGCRIHIAFHGCQQNNATVGDAYTRGSGLADWAETNRLIVLFPQVDANPVLNPLGCWDWWGYTGFDFLTRDALQIAAVHRMVAQLASR
jgi:poly(3-hydroxybutyrate) depolymerase